MAQLAHGFLLASGLPSGGYKARVPFRPLQQQFVDRSFPCVFGQPKPVFAVNRTHQLRIRSLHDSGTDRVEVNANASNASSFKKGARIQGQSVGVIEENDSLWEQISSTLRFAYAVGVYGAMALGGQAICHFIGIDKIGGFNLSANVAMEGLGYAIPPMMALLFILDDEVVKRSLHARAIRDAEDEELMGFFVGLSPWQIMFVVSLGAVSEELFFRVAIQGGLAHVFLSDGSIKERIDGIAALTGVFPLLAPFAHALAAVLTAALSGSILFVTSAPQDPKYVIAPVLRNQASVRELKKSFAAWYERRQLRRIYSPLLESMLALYLGFEWMETGNVLAPIITHVVYSSVTVGNGVWKIHEQRDRLRQRRFICEQNHDAADYLSEKL